MILRVIKLGARELPKGVMTAADNADSLKSA